MIDSRRNQLERLLSPHEALPALEVETEDRPTWLYADGWRVFASPRSGEETGVPFERFTLADGRVLSAYVCETSHAVVPPFDPGEAYEHLVSERWRAGSRRRGLSSNQLSGYYTVKRFVPRRAQLLARRGLIRWQGSPEFPAWPFEGSLVQLLGFYIRCLLLAKGSDELTFDWFWPAPFQAAAILTHDVESAEGLRLAVELADLEEERGLRSSFNIVARWYPIDEGIAKELLARGFELGVHGVYHDRSMFSSRPAFDEQLPIVRDFAARIDAAGFRSPSTHRVFEWLAELPLDYDCTLPHSDPYEPIPGGCCTLWPFFIGDVVELPYTLPQDHTLFTLLGDRSIEHWQHQLDRIESLGGLVQVLTHPDPGYLGDLPKRALYVQFLDLIRERPALWKPLPREAARWWRQRDTGAPGDWPVGVGRASLEETGEVTLRLQPA